MESINKTKKIIKADKPNGQTLQRQLTKTNPQDSSRPQKPQQLINVAWLCRQLIFPKYSTDQKSIIKKLTNKFSQKWKGVQQTWRNQPARIKIDSLVRRNASLYWQWYPSRQIRGNEVVLSYLSVQLHNKCCICGEHLVPFGNARKNGRDHNDWIGRKQHKQCWKERTFK